MLFLKKKIIRIGLARIISAKADVESCYLMRETAGFLGTSAAMQIRYLETINMVGG